VFKMYELIIKGGGFPIEVTTDAILYVCVPDVACEGVARQIAAPIITKPDGTFLNFPGVFWDKEGTKPMYKWEKATLNQAERLDSTRVGKKEDFDPTEWTYDFDDTRTDGRDESGMPTDHTEWGQRFIREDVSGLYMCGRPGTGKSHLTRVMVAEAKKVFGDEAVEVLAPTNVSARNIDGATIHKFFKIYDAAMGSSGTSRKKMQRKLMELRIVFVDEISMLHTWFWGKLCALQSAFSHLRFIMVGDFGQLDPVADVNDKINYTDNVALYALTYGARFRLTECRRADKAFFDICADVDGINVALFPVSAATLFNICYVHRTRKRVNRECEMAFIEGKDTTHTIAASHTLTRSQDVTLCVGYPLLSRTNDGAQNKNEFWVVASIGQTSIKTVRVPLEHEADAEQPEIEVELEQFHHQFEPGFCVTTHTAQGMTLRSTYTIHDWDKMHTKLRNVAITRATGMTGVQIDNGWTRFPADWRVCVAGLTFEEAAKQQPEYCKQLLDRTDLTSGSILERFQEFLREQADVDMSEDESDEEEEDEHTVQQQMAQPCVREKYRQLQRWEDGMDVVRPMKVVESESEEEEESEHIIRLREAQKEQKRRREEQTSHPPVARKRFVPNIPGVTFRQP
jgi:hypothetical protein